MVAVGEVPIVLLDEQKLITSDNDDSFSFGGAKEVGGLSFLCFIFMYS